MRTRGKPWLIGLLLAVVIGLVPGMAIAEDVAGAPDSGDSNVAAEPAAIEAAEDAGDSVAPDAAESTSSEPEESVATDDASLVVEQQAAEDKEAGNPAKANKADKAEKPAEPAKDGNALVALSDDDEFPWSGYEVGNLSYGSTSAALNGGEAWFVFTATESGQYIFSSSDASDPYAMLYDAEGNDLSSDDDAGEGNNFLFAYNLEAGQSYYLRVGTYEADETVTINVALFDAYDFNQLLVDCDNRNVAYDEGTLRYPGLQFFDIFGDPVELEEGTDYECTVLDMDENPITEQVADESYFLVITPCDPYHGDAKTIEFYVVGAGSLSAATLEVEELEFNGKVQHPEIHVFLDGVELEPDCYDVVWYDGNDQVVDGPSKGDAEYYVEVTGIEEKGYFDSTGQWYRLTTRSIYDADWDVSDVLYTGKPVVIPAPVYNGETLKLGTDYTLSFYTESAWQEAYEDASTIPAPTQPGEYVVCAVGKGLYSDSSAIYFEIIDSYDITRCYVNVIDGWFPAGGIPATFEVAVYPLKGNGEHDYDNPLVSQLDYTVSYQRFTGSVEEDYDQLYDDAYWTAVKSFDGKTTGIYRAVVTGKKPYHGTATSYDFEVFDGKNLENSYVNLGQFGVIVGEDGTVTPNPVLKMGTAIVPNNAYTVQYYAATIIDNEDAGEAVYDPDSTPVSLPLSIDNGDLYAAVMTAVDGSGYTGQRVGFFKLRDNYNLEDANIDTQAMRYAATENGVVLDFSVRAPNGEIIAADNYDVVYYVYDENADEYVAFEGGVPKDPASYVFSVKAKLGTPYKNETSQMPFEIVESNDLSGARIALEGGEDVLYTGKKAVPPFTVTLAGELLAEGVDYDVVFFDGRGKEVASPTAIGDYTICVRPHEGSGYVGEAEQFFYIVRSYYDAISLKDAQITVAKATYTGKALKPKVTVKLAGAVVPADGYDITYRNNTQAGTAAVVLSGKGYYASTVAKTFVISKATNPLTAKAKTVKAKKKKTTTFKASKVVTVKKAQGKVTYKKANKAGKSKIKVAANGKVTVKKGLKKGTYKVKISVTAAGNANYNKVTKTVTVKIKVK